MNAKGQAALEFLTTYGWAFIVIIIAISALAYFGILSPSKFLPERCTMGPEFECQEYQIDSGQNRIRLKLKNNVNQVIAISSMSIGSESSTALSCSTVPSLNGPKFTSGFWSQLGLVAYDGNLVNDGSNAPSAFHTDSSGIGSYLQLDLGAGNAKAMNGLSVWIDGVLYATWNIQYSDDASAWTNAYTGFDLNVPGAPPNTPFERVISWDNVGSHRYWRLYKTNAAAGGWYHREIQFYDTNLGSWKPSQAADLEWGGCNNAAAGLVKGEKSKLLVSIVYYPIASGPSYSKEIKGEILANVI